MASESPAAGSSAPAESSSSSESVVGSPSTIAGAAPGGGDGSALGGAPEDPSAALVPPAGFQFAGRKWGDQTAAENAIRAELGRQRGIQKENSKLTSELTDLRQQVASLRALVGPGQGQAQGQPRAQEGPASLADQLLKDGTLDIAAQMAENPEQGLRHALYAIAQGIEGRMNTQLERFEAEKLSPMIMRNQQERVVANAIGSAQRLAQQFPELDASNDSEEAEQVQNAIVGMIQENVPPEVLAKNPEYHLLAATLISRHLNGTPMFAEPPGTSGSPSFRAAQAAEAAQAASSSVPLDGSGVPRPRLNGAEGPQDRIRRENKEINSRVAKTVGGRPLGFDLPS